MNDPGLETVRAARHAISREFENDPARLIAHYLEMQSRYKGGPLIQGPAALPSDAESDMAGGTNPNSGNAEQR